MRSDGCLASSLILALDRAFEPDYHRSFRYSRGGAFVGLKKRVTDIVQDERSILIDMKTAAATIKAAVVLFLTVNLATIVYVFSGPLGFQSFTYHRPNDVMLPAGGFESVSYFPVPPETIPISQLGLFAVLQLIMIVAALFIYVGFRFYYARKFGVWGEDEE